MIKYLIYIYIDHLQQISHSLVLLDMVQLQLIKVMNKVERMI